MTLLKDNNYKEINVALLSLEADIKNKISGFDTSVIDKQLVEINNRIDKINAGDNNTSAEINDIRYEIEDINSKLNGNSAKIENIEQKLSDIFSAENKVTDFNNTKDSGIYYWLEDAANKPGTDYGVLLVNKYGNGGDVTTGLWINQIAYGTNNKIYFRQNINSGNWTEWKAVAFEGQINADTVDNYHASQLWRSDGATWNPNANVVMTPSGNDSEWSFDFRNKNGATGAYWQVWDENKNTLLKVNADDGKVSAPYGFVGNLSGKASTAGTATNANHAETAETATKMSNALTVNGKTYNGSEAVDAGVQTVANGGTGVTTQADINKAFISNLDIGESDVTDGTEFVSSYASDKGFADPSGLNKPHKRQFIKVWNYIKDKISSVLGLTKDNYGGKSAKSSFLDEYPGAGGTRPTSGNIKPKDSSEYGGMRKDVVTSSMTDSGHPEGEDGHLLTMFWDNSGRYDSQFFVSNDNPPTVKARSKANGTDYGPWIDVITSNNIGTQTVASATTARTAADAGFLCKLYTLASATSDTTTQANNVILLGKIPDPASTEAPATPSASWDIDVDFYFVRSTGHKAAWCNVKAGYGYSNAWRKYGLIETFGVDVGSNYTNPFYLVTLKYNNEYYIGVRHMININGSYAARVKYVNTGGSRNPSTVNNTPLVNMLKVIPYQKTNGTVLNSEIKTSIADFPNTYAPAVERNGSLVLSNYNDVKLSTFGNEPLSIGTSSSTNLGIDNNEIQARDNGKASTLYLNNNGGNVEVGGSSINGAKLVIQGATVNSNSYTDTNPKLEFKNNDNTQNISLTFNDFDSVQAPASLTLNGNQGNEYFIAPNIKATTKFIGDLTGNVTGNVTGSSGSCTGNSATATSAGKLTTARTAYVELGMASTSMSTDWSGTTTIPVNGVLQVEHGGTGADTALSAANAFINSLSASQDVPVDSDYFISQAVNGGPAYNRRPISKLWEYIKDKILQEGEDFGYNHIVHDDASLLEWANCTDGSMKKVLVKSGTYNMTKGVDFSKAGTGYVFAENGAVINSKVPIAFTAPSGKTTIHNLSVICGPSSDNTCAFSASNIENLILYDCEASYATNTITVNRNLFSKCTCYNCHYNFTYSSSNSSMSIKVFYQCYCYNCICKQTIAANSSAVSFATGSYFYKECVCVSCDAELTILRNIKAATPSFSCYYNCWDRCVGCLSTINVNNSALTVYSTLYGFMRCQHMSSCKEVHTVGYSNIKGVVQCIYISSTSAVSGESNTNVGNSCDI